MHYGKLLMFLYSISLRWSYGLFFEISRYFAGVHHWELCTIYFAYYCFCPVVADISFGTDYIVLEEVFMKLREGKYL